MLRTTLLLISACLLAPGLQAQDQVELPFPEASTFFLPKNPDLYFSQKVITVEDEFGAPLNFFLLNSADFTIETPPTEDWSVRSEDKDHSAVFSHRLVDSVKMTFDCYRTETLPELTPDLLQSKINQEAFLLTKQGFNRFQVEAEEEDFTATVPTRKLQMADGTIVEVAKRGRVKPLRVADQYLYDLIAQKVDSQGNITEQHMIHETFCVHPMGYTLVCRVEGDVRAAALTKGWLRDFLRSSQENAALLQASRN